MHVNTNEMSSNIGSSDNSECIGKVLNAAGEFMKFGEEGGGGGG